MLKQSQTTIICQYSKPSGSVANLSHLRTRKSAQRKLHHDCGVDTNNVLQIIRVTNWVVYGGNTTSRNIYLCLHSHANFVRNNKPICFVKVSPTMSSEYLFVGNSITRFVKVTARYTQLLKLSVKFFNSYSTCSIIKLMNHDIGNVG